MNFNPDLRPCPFCGSQHAPRITLFGLLSQHVECNKRNGGCGARSDKSIAGRTAADTWNRRAKPAAYLS